MPCVEGKILLVNPGYDMVAILIRSEFSDLNAHAKPIFLLCSKFQIIIFKTVEVAETQTLLYKINFLSKSRVHNSTQ